MKRFLSLLLCLISLGFLAIAEPAQTPVPRDLMIDAIIQNAKELYDKAGGRLQSAHYASDIYLCKNFTVEVFKRSRDGFALKDYPDVQLVIPNNLPKEQSKPHQYGIEWEHIAPENGNPFELAAQFKYNKDLSKKENIQLATEFMHQVKKGDYFQMSAKYYYGVGAHSLIFIADYDPDTDSVHWTDSNMKGQKKKGIRHGLAQFDAVKKVEWFVDAFCQPGRGASLYRLREDIIQK
ncbi:MAG: hypothetical protein ACOX6G_00265 [Christensenellales bacterium]|jgi:hypothetical protein